MKKYKLVVTKQSQDLECSIMYIISIIDPILWTGKLRPQLSALVMIAQVAALL